MIRFVFFLCQCQCQDSNENRTVSHPSNIMQNICISIVHVTPYLGPMCIGNKNNNNKRKKYNNNLIKDKNHNQNNNINGLWHSWTWFSCISLDTSIIVSLAEYFHKMNVEFFGLKITLTQNLVPGMCKDKDPPKITSLNLYNSLLNKILHKLMFTTGVSAMFSCLKI